MLRCCNGGDGWKYSPSTMTRRLLTTAAGCVAVAGCAAVAPLAEARPCASRVGGYYTVTKKRPGTSCVGARFVLEDLLEVHPRAPYTPGRHRWTVPDRGANYEPGDDWHCLITTRFRSSGETDGGKLAAATGTCVYRSRSTTRFWFRGRYGS